jgi:hypothetical protein
MPYRASPATLHTATRAHCCSWCGQSIAPGELYLQQRLTWDQGLSTLDHTHQECHAAATAAAATPWKTAHHHRGQTADTED